MEQEFIQAFREVLREQILRRNEVQLDSLGVFRFEHRNQFQKQHEDGRVVMMPPQDTITFSREKPGT